MGHEQSEWTPKGKSCSFCLPRVPFVNCRQFMYLVISLLVLRAGYGIWLYQFLIIAYLFTLCKLCWRKNVVYTSINIRKIKFIRNLHLNKHFLTYLHPWAIAWKLTNTICLWNTVLYFHVRLFFFYFIHYCWTAKEIWPVLFSTGYVCNEIYRLIFQYRSY